MENLTTVTEMITPQKAAEYLTKNLCNRKKNENTVNYYAKQMANGEWMLTSQGISIDNEGFLLDGQHRMFAIIKANVVIPMRVTRGEPHSNFLAYDTGKSRSASDVLSIGQVANANNVSAIVRKYLSLLNGHTAKGNGNTKISNQYIYNTYGEHKELFSEIARLSNAYRNRMNIITGSSIGGSIVYLILSCGYDKQYVIDFFDKLYDMGDGTPQTTMLRSTLIRNMALKTKSYSLTVKEQLLIKTWNHYVSGRSVACLKWTKETEGFLSYIKKSELKK